MTTLLIAILLLACPPQGDAKDAPHAALNRLKNRATAPASYAAVPFNEFAGAGASGFGSAYQTKYGKAGAVLTGWVVKVKRAGPESCNCHDKALRDVHIYLGPRAGAPLSECVICEIPPRWQGKVKAPATGSHVAISGWAFYDQQHAKGAEKWRATAWEIHPVTGIDLIR